MSSVNSVYGIQEISASVPMAFSLISLFAKGEKERVYRIVKESLQAYGHKVAEFNDSEMTVQFCLQEKEAKLLIIKCGLSDYFNLKSISYKRAPCCTSFCAQRALFILKKNSYNALQREKKNLLSAAESFYTQRSRISVAIGKDQRPAHLSKLFSSLLKNFEGICIGEYWQTHISAKALIIKQIGEFYQLGVRSLYVDRLFYDTMHQHLEGKSPLPGHIEDFLEECDEEDEAVQSDFSFSRVIKTALATGIRVVPIETTISHAFDKGCLGESIEECVKATNFVATCIIEEEQKKVPGKYAVFLSAKHLVEYVERVPGVSELLGIPSLLIKDSAAAKATYMAYPNILCRPVSLYIEAGAAQVLKKRKRAREEGGEEQSKERKIE